MNQKPTKALSTYEIELNSQDTFIEFSFEKTIVRTINTEEENKLVILIEENVEEFDANFESRRYGRPKVLIVLGVMSFITGNNYSIYEVSSGTSFKGEHAEAISTGLERNKPFKFIVGESNHTESIKKICKIINKEFSTKNTLFFSLLDRWRKAQYQVQESDGKGLYEDESLLSFFHVLELLVTEYEETQKSIADEKLSNFLEDIFENIFKYQGHNLNTNIEQQKKMLKKVLISTELISINNRLKFMLDQQGLLDDRVRYLIQELISARNSIAHGRQVYREKLMWPLPPFFTLHDHHLELNDCIEVLTARSVSIHYNLPLWKNEWEELLKYLSPSKDIIKSFLSNEIYSGLSIEAFQKGDINFVTPNSIINLYIKSKVKYSDFEKCFTKYLNVVNIETNNTEDIFYISIIIADSPNEELSLKCQKNIQNIYANKLYFQPNIKDYLRYIEYQGIEVNWFRNWITNGMDLIT